MASTTKASALVADLPEPHAIIAWNALNLVTAIRTDETLIDEGRRADIAAVLEDAGLTCIQAAARLKHSPAGAAALRRIQNQHHRKPGN